MTCSSDHRRSKGICRSFCQKSEPSGNDSLPTNVPIKYSAVSRGLALPFRGVEGAAPIETKLETRSTVRAVSQPGSKTECETWLEMCPQWCHFEEERYRELDLSAVIYQKKKIYRQRWKRRDCPHWELAAQKEDEQETEEENSEWDQIQKDTNFGSNFGLIDDE